jgi:hypothetical protein
MRTGGFHGAAQHKQGIALGKDKSNHQATGMIAELRIQTSMSSDKMSFLETKRQQMPATDARQLCF